MDIIVIIDCDGYKHHKPYKLFSFSTPLTVTGEPTPKLWRIDFSDGDRVTVTAAEREHLHHLVHWI